MVVASLAAAAWAPSAEAIVGGTASDTADDTTVLLLTHDPARDTRQGPFFLNCTGVRISPRLVLTARRCLAQVSSGTFQCDQTGAKTSGAGGSYGTDFVPGNTMVFTGPMFPGAISSSNAAAVGSSYVHGSGAVLCNEDLALVVLDRAVPGNYAPVRLEGAATTGESLTVVGWGATTTSTLPTQRQRRTGVTIVEVGPSATAHPGGQLGDREFLATESACTGDSGGPAFSTSTGAVVGVVSRGATPGPTGLGCVGTQQTFMVPAAFRTMVLQAFTLTGETPWREGQPPPPGWVDPRPKDAGAPADSGTGGTTAGTGRDPGDPLGPQPDAAVAPEAGPPTKDPPGDQVPDDGCSVTSAPHGGPTRPRAWSLTGVTAMGGLVAVSVLRRRARRASKGPQVPDSRSTSAT